MNIHKRESATSSASLNWVTASSRADEHRETGKVACRVSYQTAPNDF